MTRWTNLVIMVPQVRQELGDIAAGRLDVVLATPRDRLYRRAADLERLIPLIESTGVSVRTKHAGEVDLLATGDGQQRVHELHEPTAAKKAKLDEANAMFVAEEIDRAQLRDITSRARQTLAEIEARARRGRRRQRAGRHRRACRRR